MPELHRCAVLGDPISHSLSPVLHRAAYKALGLEGWSYEAIRCPSGGLSNFFDTMDESWAGLSLTMPLKREVLPLLDAVEPQAKALGVVNTVIPQAMGRTRGFVGANTDIYGIVQAVREIGVEGAPLEVQRIDILGSGATACSALVACGQLAQGVAAAHGDMGPVAEPAGQAVEIHVWARTLGHTVELRRVAEKLGVDVVIGRWDDERRMASELRESDVVVSTVPSHAADGIAAQLGEAKTGSCRGRRLLDVVYAPYPTALDTAWVALGGGVAPGYAMLLHQACEQVRLITGKPAPVDAMRHALVAAL